MNEDFQRYVESLHPKFERLTHTTPVKVAAIPKDAPRKAIYLFSEGGQNLYVGRTNRLRDRMREHSMPSARHNQAVLAFRLAREQTGRITAAYSKEGGRAALSEDPAFDQAFAAAKARVRQMDLRFVEETDPFRQALLEIYAAIALDTHYNDFETH
jgi:predicted GIY-YIG superfamily endonuclease